MKNFLILLFLPFLATSLLAQETLVERRLKALVSRERAIFMEADAAENPSVNALQMQVQRILREYDLLIQENPEYAPALVAYGLLLGRIGEDRAALAMLMRANRIDPSIALVKNQIGKYLAEDGDYGSALNYLLAAVELEPKEPLYHYQIGTLLYEFRAHFLKDRFFDRATLDRQMLSSFARAAELEPKNIGYAYRHAEAHYDLENPDWDLALREWRSLETQVAAGIERQTIQLHQANVLIQKENFDAARRLLQGIDAEALAPNKQTLIDLLPENVED